jgi:hypothetical protein
MAALWYLAMERILFAYLIQRCKKAAALPDYQGRAVNVCGDRRLQRHTAALRSGWIREGGVAL